MHIYEMCMIHLKITWYENVRVSSKHHTVHAYICNVHDSSKNRTAVCTAVQTVHKNVLARCTVILHAGKLGEKSQSQWTGPRVFCTSHRGGLDPPYEWYVKCQSNFFRKFSEYFRKFIKKYIQPEITYRVISIFINISEIFPKIYDCYLQYVYR